MHSAIFVFNVDITTLNKVQEKMSKRQFELMGAERAPFHFDRCTIKHWAYFLVFATVVRYQKRVIACKFCSFLLSLALVSTIIHVKILCMEKTFPYATLLRWRTDFDNCSKSIRENVLFSSIHRINRLQTKFEPTLRLTIQKYAWKL